jgi:RNA polymerase sigma-70 factor (ECF subfamily)
MHPTYDSDPVISQPEDGCPQEVVEGCQRGDRGCQQQFYQFCHLAIYRLMVRMVGLQEAADVTQQVFLQAFRKMGQFAGQSRVETWLHRLAVNEALQHLRRLRRRREASLEVEPADHKPHQEGNLENQELLDAALDRLEPELKTIFLKRELEQMSYHQLAATFDLPPGTVASRLNRARRLLQEHLVDLGWEAPS